MPGGDATSVSDERQLRVDMQGKDGPHEGIVTFGALFTTWPPIYKSIICGRRGSDCIQTCYDKSQAISLEAVVHPRSFCPCQSILPLSLLCDDPPRRFLGSLQSAIRGQCHSRLAAKRRNRRPHSHVTWSLSTLWMSWCAVCSAQYVSPGSLPRCFFYRSFFVASFYRTVPMA